MREGKFSFNCVQAQETGGGGKKSGGTLKRKGEKMGGGLAVL